MSPPSSDAPLDDITIPSNDFFRIDYNVQNSSPLTSELNPEADQSRRYPLCSRKVPNRFGFSKPSSNVIYPIRTLSLITGYLRLIFGFSLQWSSVSIPNHFQEDLKDPKWKSALIEEIKALQKNST